MDNEQKQNFITLWVGVLLLILIAIGLVYYFWYFKKDPSPASDIYGGVEIENLAPPSTNPVKTVAPESTPVEKTNPFKYENPFE